jgi:hypothetical protein
MGSFMRLLYDPRQGALFPAYVRDRVLLAQAGIKCIGCPRDEMIVRTVSDMLRRMQKRRVAVLGAPVSQPRLLVAQQDQLRESGRRYEALPDSDLPLLAPPDLEPLIGAGKQAKKQFFRRRARDSRPMEMPHTVQQAVANARQAGGLVRAVPVDITVLHAQERHAAGSEVRARVSSVQLRFLRYDPHPHRPHSSQTFVPCRYIRDEFSVQGIGYVASHSLCSSAVAPVC